MNKRLMAATMFRFVGHFRRASITFLGRIGRLRTAINMFLNSEGGRAWIHFGRLFLHATNFHFASKRAAISVFGLLSNRTNFFFGLLRFLRNTVRFFESVIRFFQPQLIRHGYHIRPNVTNFITNGRNGRIFLQRFTLLGTRLRSRAFLHAGTIRRSTRTISRMIGLLQRRTRLFRCFERFRSLFLDNDIATAFHFSNIAHCGMLDT